MFYLSQTAIDENMEKSHLRNSRAGALATFEGWVRDLNEGREVTLLEYESYQSMAEKEANKILQEAKSKFDILDVRCVHRVGTLQIGDMAVWVGVISMHRKDAFAACQYVIDQLKARVPIWKKEHYQEGDSGWIGCHTQKETV